MTRCDHCERDIRAVLTETTGEAFLFALRLALGDDRAAIDAVAERMARIRDRQSLLFDTPTDRVNWIESVVGPIAPERRLALLAEAEQDGGNSDLLIISRLSDFSAARTAVREHGAESDPRT